MNYTKEILELMETKLDADTEVFCRAFFENGEDAVLPPLIISYNGITAEIPLYNADVHGAFTASLALFRNALEEEI